MKKSLKIYDPCGVKCKEDYEYVDVKEIKKTPKKKKAKKVKTKR